MDDPNVETLIEDNAQADESSDNELVAYQSNSESDSEDEFRRITNFSAVDAYDILYNQLSYTKIYLDYDLQKELALEIGVNVSEEHPWKSIRKELLEEYLTENTQESENLKVKLNLLDHNDVVLVGFYCQDHEDGIFLVYDECESILIASQLIEKLEIWQRFKIKRALFRKPKLTELSRDSKAVVIPTKKAPRKRLSVVIEMPCRTPTMTKEFVMRTSADCRDGYLSLLPGEMAHENVYRKRIDQGQQAARKKVDVEQQTDPTFPSNAHSQYVYEILKEAIEEPVSLEVDPAAASAEETDDNDVDGDTQSQSTQSVRRPTVRRPIRNLLKTLEFNQVDLYCNDYQFIGQCGVPKFRIPYLEEVFCFADIAKTSGRYCADIAWHPQYSGLCVATYCWETLSASDDRQTVDPIDRITLQPNHIIMWSFADTLRPKLTFESPREVAILSFNPRDPTCLLGGLVNGQIIIWDLTDFTLIDDEQGPHGSSQHWTGSSTREEMRKFLKWTKDASKSDIVKGTAISSLECSQSDRITNIKWLHSSVYLTETGELKESSSSGRKYQYFVTSSMDGSVAFWNLDTGSVPEEKAPPAVKKKGAHVSEEKPHGRFSSFDRKFRPQFIINIQFPVTDFIINDAKFICTNLSARTNQNLSGCLDFKVQEMAFTLERSLSSEDEEEGIFHNQFVAATALGDLLQVKWKGLDSDATVVNKIDKPMIQTYPHIHDGPIVALEKNPLIHTLILAIGLTTFSIWSVEYPENALYWQNRRVVLTSCQWSTTRPSVFFITRADGSVELWDVLSQMQDPCLVESISGGILTRIVQHGLRLSRDLIVVADCNSSVRVFGIPETFSRFTDTDKSRLIEQINHQVTRKRDLKRWQDEWAAENQDIIEASRHMSGVTGSGAEQGTNEPGDTRRQKQKQQKGGESPERVVNDDPERKWEQMNLKRLMKTMMTIKNIDPEDCQLRTATVRERKAYNLLKEKAIKQSYSQVDADFAKIRTRLLPVPEDIEDRRQLVRDTLGAILSCGDWDPAAFAAEQRRVIGKLTDPKRLGLLEIESRGRKVREILSKSSGGNFLHRDMYEEYKKLDRPPTTNTFASNNGDSGSALGMRRDKSVTFSEIDH